MKQELVMRPPLHAGKVGVAIACDGWMDDFGFTEH